MNSIIAWVGGKRLMRKNIIKLIPEHNRYIEVFGGAGWVLFGKSDKKEDWTKSKEYLEIYNDINTDLVTFWKYLRNHPEAVSAELHNQLASRQLFNERKSGNFRTELERVVTFYLQLRLSYGSNSKNFCISHSNNLMPLKDIDLNKKVSERLLNVVIENMDFSDLINKYDNKESFFFCDPPYYECEQFYIRNNAAKFDKHEQLKDMLSTIKGKFLLTYNDNQYIKELYKNFNINPVQTKYSFSGSQTTVTNLIITNY